MLCAVLFVKLGCKYVGGGVGNLFFFYGGEKGKGKSSFGVFGFGMGEADCKCAFPFVVGFFASWILNYGRILFTIERI